MTPPDEDTDVLVRPAAPDDAPAVAAVHLAARRTASMPPSPHPDDEALTFLRGRMALDETWVAEVAGEVVAYLRMTDTWLDDLYVHPDHAGHGVGSTLLDVAKARRPDGFSLWVFEVNTPARAFYARHGLVEREHTDGRDNDEQAPDLRMSWGQE
ncbi:GNAT family N-acetyltransferase [Nocardioides litoris]|uniref:GNAT family N-acetyltransferase n=1 Tax=Nocardioides litoris TaxID=1926648 RepID=UPI00111EB95B|nr:GNAT family N-acetyltransferase [Nocardioides litoris]